MKPGNQEAGSTEGTRVLIVDDHAIVRQGIRMLIANEPDMVVCGEAEDSVAALNAAEQAQPHVAIVDLSLGESSGLELIRELHGRCPELRVLVLSMRDESFYAERALAAGALGYVTKREGAGRIIDGIREVRRGNVFVSERMASRVLQRMTSGTPTEDPSPISQLSDRELEVFEMIGNGIPTREISLKLHISPKTVDSHREHIKNKLALGSASELLKYAVEWVQCRYQA